MVSLHVSESQLLLQAPESTELEELRVQVAHVHHYNWRLKVQHLCSEMEELPGHGVFLPPNMQGLTDDQIEELKLRDEWGEKCMPSWGLVNRQAPNEKMKQVLKKTIEEAKAIISKKQVEARVCITMEMVKDALDQLRWAVMIVYPMGLPSYDPIRMEFENKICQELRGQGALAREPIISSEEQKQLMLYYHRRQEELKRLEENDDDTCLNSPWADNTALKRHFHGVKDKKWRPR
uniref:Uncharacterized protein n=1 Tax=Microcebus murinus TaxID=30608 RepID=A0A8C6EI64_MICMU